MEIQTLNCNCCGAPLLSLDTEGLYACSHCNALHVTSDASAAKFGQKIDEIHHTTRQIAEDLKRIDLGQRRDCRHYLAPARSGVGRPGLNVAVIFAVVFCSFGLFCLIGCSASVLVFLVGLGCIAAGVVGGIVIDNKTVSNERRQALFARYQKRPQSLGVVRGGHLYYR